MGFAAKSYCSLLCMLVLLITICYSQEDYASSKATYSGSPGCFERPSGACGYGEFGRKVNNANVAGVSMLYRNGSGCGGCYHVRCKIPKICSTDGVRVVVTDYGEGHGTDFILSDRAYSKLAVPNAALELFPYDAVDIEYKRIPCRYPGYNLKLKVHEQSSFPAYLAVIILYQAGVYDITAVEVWQADDLEWRCMKRSFGTVWDLPSPPSGPLTFKVQVSGNGCTKWVQMTNVVPNKWKAGDVYDTTIQLS
ncbi:expansin-like B1 [Diospyros lotus]|uniref:expansin-like B1 n=1 Tax=Diospyros lotus TaxID=55363 RepID=UPI00225AD446|nr:expansin-like B1 [Diospyros lotus]